MRVILAGTVTVALVTGLFLFRPSLVDRIEEGAYDLLAGLVSRGSPSGQTAIVEIDDASLQQIGRWPWRRDRLARLVRRVFDRGASVVVLDMMLHEEDRGASETNPAIANDDVFASEITGRPVVIGYAFQFNGAKEPAVCGFRPAPLAVVRNGEWGGVGFHHATRAICTAKRISASAAAAGFLNAAPDTDG